MGYRYTIRVYDDPQFYKNAVVFATKAEAESAALNKFTAWTQAAGWRVEETKDAANYKFEDGQIVYLHLRADGQVVNLKTVGAGS